MIDATHRFDDRAEDYARHRPGYARELVPRLAAERGLPPGAHVADMGCGTGLLARSFLDAGCRVTGVEPSDPMRTQAGLQLGVRPGFACRAGTAEASGLPDACVHAVVAGQAFHWFDVERARAEFARVLRPGGWVALIWNDRSDPALRSTHSLSIQTLITKALPVMRWQSRQWHAWTTSGVSVSR